MFIYLFFPCILGWLKYTKDTLGAAAGGCLLYYGVLHFIYKKYIYNNFIIVSSACLPVLFAYVLSSVSIFIGLFYVLGCQVVIFFCNSEFKQAFISLYRGEQKITIQPKPEVKNCLHVGLDGMAGNKS